MNYFDYDKTSEKAEYYEILQDLMERWEYEIVEFKEAKGSYSEDKMGQYFSVGDRVDLVYQMNRNTFNGMETAQIVISDMERSGSSGSPQQTSVEQMPTNLA